MQLHSLRRILRAMLSTIRNGHAERIDYELRGPDVRRELVVIGHGVTANRDRPFLVALADALSEIGVPSLRFSFSGNGASEGRFEDSTISKEVEDLGAVIDALEPLQLERLTFVGHSMGGAVGVLRTASDPRIHALASLAGMVFTRDFCERKFGALTPGQDLMWDKPECPLSQAFVDDLTSIGDVLRPAAAIRVPWLLVHGTGDTVVLPRDSHEARAAAGGRPQLIEIPDVDHVFSDAGTARMCEAVVGWYRELGAGD